MICSSIFFSSCDTDLLETPAYGETTAEAFWRNADDAYAASTAMYAPLLSEWFYGHQEMVFENCSDDIYRAGDHPYEEAMENFTMDASNTGVSRGWSTKYEMIIRANAVIMNVPKIEGMDESDRERILGEAYFLRAFGYWRFHVIFGGVPIILEQNIIDANFNVKKATIAEMRTQIESDLIIAASKLPATQSSENLGRVNKGTANGLLAKLYLYQEDFAKAIEAGNQVISGPYPLAPNFRDNFVPETENNPEMLFAVQSNQEAMHLNIIYLRSRNWGGWDMHNPTQGIVDAFEVGDPRREDSILETGRVLACGNGAAEFGVGYTPTSFMQYKYMNLNLPSDGCGIRPDTNIPLLRSADVLLMVAEAKIRQNGSGAGDTELNAVRTRVGLAPVSNAGMPELIHERRIELFGEQQRHQDLMRWDKAGIVDIVAIYGADNGQFDPSRTFVKPKNYYFPLPQIEIDKSNGVLIQNDGY